MGTFPATLSPFIPSYQLDNIESPCYVTMAKAARRTTHKLFIGYVIPVLWGYKAKETRQSKTTLLIEEDIP